MTDTGLSPERPRGRLAGLGACLIAALVVLGGCTPSPSAEGSSSPSSSASSEPTVLPSATPVAEPELAVRLTIGNGNPPTLTMYVEIMSDGQVVLGGDDPWTTRSLTVAGLDEVGQEVLDAPLLQASGLYPAEAIPLSDPIIGMNPPTWTFTLGGGSDPVVVTSSAWLGDEAEAMYFVPSPERQELDRLAHLLASVSDWVTADGWASADWTPYEATSYLLWVTVWTASDVNPLPDGLPSAVGISWPFDGPIEEFGDVVATNLSTGRCGYLDPSQEADLVMILTGLGIDPPTLSRVDSQVSMDLATETGWVGIYLSPRTVDSFPTCADAVPFLPPYGP
jgi:hypothetical protein